MIDVTEKAIKEVKKLMQQENKGEQMQGLRVGVKGGGCSGLSYFLEFEKEPRSDDNILELDGIKVFLDPKSALYLKGTKLDFSDGLNGKGFEFSNPNAQRTCGCGSSFGV
ncbi:iron-sulfur cluster assembly accessory protein [candidate division KSB1 bacterium]|nr:iron-sulfur cluster assembly accessory protein [candidate division KSB1 bacterium]NIR71360.1 iron-sulfur cluster assembly accessory protein [candidate division KSB1 bacterium]NIS26250.1 iron-sulfur cluster assembly accessory protein [candidate division KSB1 bacterium]NIT73001.1 iron-sulfur cluster assembly accessory protein [candidate division KSB1 bacterium]NIU26898.1 iron-sulfur cluster assembly accessory protein [candidate division KSB1 bacterium]